MKYNTFNLVGSAFGFSTPLVIDIVHHELIFTYIDVAIKGGIGAATGLCVTILIKKAFRACKIKID